MTLPHMPHLMLAAALILIMYGIGSADGLRHRLLAGASNTTDSEEFLSVHNAARAAVGVPPLRWSPKLAAMADRLAMRHKGCGFVSVNDKKFGSIQDLHGEPPAGSARLAVEGWVETKQYYHHGNNTCDNEACTIYLQIVWRKTLELGCKRVVCPKTGKPPVVAALSLCLYSPPGNVKGEIPY